MKNLFRGLEDFNSFMRKLHVLHHIVDDVFRFGGLYFVDAATFEHFNFIIKILIKMTFIEVVVRFKRL